MPAAVGHVVQHQPPLVEVAEAQRSGVGGLGGERGGSLWQQGNACRAGGKGAHKERSSSSNGFNPTAAWPHLDLQAVLHPGREKVEREQVGQPPHLHSNCGGGP